MTGLLVGLVAAALVAGVIAWQRRSLALAAVTLLLLGAVVWPWPDSGPPGRAAAIERAQGTEAAETDARTEYTAADDAVDEWHRVKGDEDPTPLRVAADEQLAALEVQRNSSDPSVASAAESQIPVIQQRRSELQSAEMQLGELTATRDDAARALAAAQAANVSAQEAIPPRADLSAMDTFRRIVALTLSGLGVAVLGAAFARQRVRAQKTEPVTWPSIFTPAPAPPIIDRSHAPNDDVTIDLTKEGPRTRSQPPVLRRTPSVPVSTPHSARKRRRHE